MAVTAINIENSRNQHILLNTTGNVDDGSLKVLATDGDYVYFTELTQSDIAKGRVNPDESVETFKEALKAVLLPLSKDRLTRARDTKRWSAVAEIHTGQHVGITVRQQVEGGLSVKAGEFHLKEASENHQVVLFDWTVESCQEAQQALDKVDQAQETTECVQNAVDMLNQQLDELTSAKTHHDRQVMDKFLKILNEKKKRIAFLESQLIAAHENGPRDSESRPNKRPLVVQQDDPEIKSEKDPYEPMQETPSPEDERTPSDSE